MDCLVLFLIIIFFSACFLSFRVTLTLAWDNLARGWENIPHKTPYLFLFQFTSRVFFVLRHLFHRHCARLTYNKSTWDIHPSSLTQALESHISARQPISPSREPKRVPTPLKVSINPYSNDLCPPWIQQSLKMNVFNLWIMLADGGEGKGGGLPFFNSFPPSVPLYSLRL